MKLNFLKHCALLALCGLACMPVVATSAEADKQQVDQRIRNSLAVLLPNLKPDSIRDSGVQGLYEVVFDSHLVYVTEDARYLVQGKIMDLETREEITEKRLAQIKVAALEALGEDNMIVYGPKDAKHTVSIFTDIDCGYCRKLHAEMQDYIDNGIRVRYMFYPRAGLQSKSYKEAVSVWCADDRKKAMDLAKAGKSVESRTCDNPVAREYKLGQTMGIRGTPAIVLENGEVIPGYVPAKSLKASLDKLQAHAQR